MTIEEILYKALDTNKYAGGGWVRDENGNLVTDNAGYLIEDGNHEVRKNENVTFDITGRYKLRNNRSKETPTSFRERMKKEREIPDEERWRKSYDHDAMYGLTNETWEEYKTRMQKQKAKIDAVNKKIDTGFNAVVKAAQNSTKNNGELQQTAQLVTTALSQSADTTQKMAQAYNEANQQAVKEKEEARVEASKPYQYLAQAVPLALALYSGGIGLADKFGATITPALRIKQAFADGAGALIDAGQAVGNYWHHNYGEGAFNTAQAGIGTLGVLGDLNLLNRTRLGRKFDKVIDFANLGSNGMEVIIDGNKIAKIANQ